jgi:hypothetical protein
VLSGVLRLGHGASIRRPSRLGKAEARVLAAPMGATCYRAGDARLDVSAATSARSCGRPAARLFAMSARRPDFDSKTPFFGGDVTRQALRQWVMALFGRRTWPKNRVHGWRRVP